MRDSGRVSSKRKTAGVPGSTSSEILPVRRASRPSAAVYMRGSSPGERARAARVASAPGPATTPAGMRSGGFSRKAKPSTMASRTGKRNTQKTASGSRTNSLARLAVSSRRALRRWPPVISSIIQPSFIHRSDIPQLPAGQGHEQVFQGGPVRGEEREPRPRLLDRGEQRGNAFGDRSDGERPVGSAPVDLRDPGKTPQLLLG